MELNNMKTFAREHEISHYRLIMLDNLKVINKEFYIQNVNKYISQLKEWVSRFYSIGLFYLPNYLA
ncbi:MAG: hypothetical protein ACTS73_06645 [Arsenophonus sp. NEOnobi-MAG3]